MTATTWTDRAQAAWQEEDQVQARERQAQLDEAVTRAKRWTEAALGEVVEPLRVDAAPGGKVRVVLRMPDDHAGYNDVDLYGLALLVEPGKRGVELQAGEWSEGGPGTVVGWYHVATDPTAADAGYGLRRGGRLQPAAEPELSPGDQLYVLLQAIVRDVVDDVVAGQLGEL